MNIEVIPLRSIRHLDTRWYVHETESDMYMKNSYWVNDRFDATPFLSQSAGEKAVNRWRLKVKQEMGREAYHGIQERPK